MAKIQKNKESIKVKDVLSHQSGLYRFKKITNNDLLDFEKITEILENQEPDHSPGEKTYYHAKTHGYLVENLIRKITKLNLNEFFEKYLSQKYDLNFNFGFRDMDFKNVSDLIEDKNENKNEINEYNAFNNPEMKIVFIIQKIGGYLV